MKKCNYYLSMLILAVGLCGCGNSPGRWQLVSPDGSVSIEVENRKEGDHTQLYYWVSHNGEPVVNSSRMGLVMDGEDFGKDLIPAGQPVKKEIRNAYRLAAGKQLDCVDHCNEMIIDYKSDSGIIFSLILRAYDDGVAFRYGFRGGDSAGEHIITEEMTEFAIPTEGKAWIHPYDWNDRHKPSYEQYAKREIAINSEPNHDKGWAFPMLFEGNKRWTFVTEALLDGTYPATHVDNSGTNRAYKIRFPEPEEPIVPDPVEPRSTLPWYTPWRVIVTGPELNDIFRTQIVTHLNPPSVIEDTSWLKAGRASWSWWYEGASVRSYKKQIQYVDLSKEMGWEYMLIDAWWQQMGDGGTMEDVVEYANKQGVGIWLWYHSGAGMGPDSPDHHKVMSTPELRKQEMARISALDVKGIKVDFFDTDKQAIIQLYPELLQDAADNKLLVNLHGATLPRGFERTYPNLMTTEAIRGAETLGRQERCDEAAWHNATVPFTRNVVGSMDYTPVTFSDKIRQGVTAYRRTTVAHQLALSVVFESGFQCFADRAEAYLSLPVYPKAFLQKVPAAWDESHLLSGYPSDHAVIARRKGNVWYIGGINGKEETRELTFSLPESCKNRKFTLITDGEDKDSFGYQELTATAGKMTVKMLENGGFAAIILD